MRIILVCGAATANMLTPGLAAAIAGIPGATVMVEQDETTQDSVQDFAAGLCGALNKLASPTFVGEASVYTQGIAAIKPRLDLGSIRLLSVEAIDEAVSALTGARAVMGDVANLSHAIALLGGPAYEPKTTDASNEPPAGVAAANEPDGVPEKPSRLTRFDPASAARSMALDVEDGSVVAVALVGITNEGAVRLIASESTGQTLNMLAQGIMLAKGDLEPEDD